MMLRDQTFVSTKFSVIICIDNSYCLNCAKNYTLVKQSNVKVTIDTVLKINNSNGSIIKKKLWHKNKIKIPPVR